LGVGALLFAALGDVDLKLVLAVTGGAIVAVHAGWWVLRSRPGARVTLHAGGVVVEGRGSRDVVFFDEVDALWLECDRRGPWYMRMTHVTGVRLIDHGGAAHRVPVEGLTAGVAIVQWLWRHCSRPLLAEARRALRAGETLTFEDVQLDATAVTVGGVRVPWSELRLVRLQPGRVAFCRRSPYWAWKTIPVDKVPHAGVFLTLIRELAPRVEVDTPFWLQAPGE
jgi:hypothetical protein